ncbi:amine oxidase, partial [Vararia minispora EC-137]
ATRHNEYEILILGGGIAGVMAAESLYQQGLRNFKVIEARNVLGGRMMSFDFGAPGRQYTLELGADWIHGTQTDDGPSNPIFDLALKHNLTTHPNDYRGSITTFDPTGQVDYLTTFYNAVEAFMNLTIAAGKRVPRGLVDATARHGYSIIGSRPRTPHEVASEYYQFDWELGQTPEQSSWIGSAWAANFTFNVEQGGYSSDNLLTVDQRSFAHIVQSEAAEFLEPDQLMLGATVRSVRYDPDGVTVVLTDGRSLTADHALVTFSLGVLQYDDVLFEPPLPDWKMEAIHGMAMGTYTKIYLQFPKKFWFDTEFALYADPERGRYPVWQGLDLEGFFPGSGLLFVTVTGDYSKRIEALPDDKVKEEVLSVLRAMYPNETVPEPDAFYFYRWNSDPLYRGSYSNWPASLVTAHHTNLRAPVGDRLWFAGEATSLKYFGYLHGAYFEGKEMGEIIARCVRAGVCEHLPHFDEVLNAAPY